MSLEEITHSNFLEHFHFENALPAAKAGGRREAQAQFTCALSADAGVSLNFDFVKSQSEFALMYGLLLITIITKTFAAASLNASKQFTRLWPSLCAIVGYAVSLYTLSHVLKYIPMGIAYAIWRALGIVLVAIIGVVYYKQHLDMAAYLGIGLIVAGVIVINPFSKSATH